MAILSALLKIRAAISGTGDVKQLNDAIDATKKTTDSMKRSFSDLAGIMATGVIGAVVGNLMEAGLAAQVTTTRIKALAGQYGEVAQVQELAAKAAARFGLGTTEARNAVANLYGRLRPMNVSLKEIETVFFGVNKAAKLVGLGAADVSGVMLQLSQALGSGRLQGDELRSIMERMPAVGQAVVRVFNDIARSKGLEQISRIKADTLISQAKESEKRQTEILKEQANLRIEALRRETERHLNEIQKRYARQQRIMEDRMEDQDDARRRANDRELQTTLDGISQRADAERTAVDRRFEDQRKMVEDDKTINEQRKTELLRALDDEKSIVLKAVQDREAAAADQVRLQAEARNKAEMRLARDARQRQTEELQSRQKAEEEALQGLLQRRKQAIDAGLKSDIEANKKATERMIANINSRAEFTVGMLKQLGSEGKITTDVMIKAAAVLDQIKAPPPTSMQQYTQAMENLGTELGKNLVPILTPFIVKMTELVRVFAALPEPVQTGIVGLALLTASLIALSTAITVIGPGFVALMTAIAGLAIGVKIAGIATVIQVAFSGLLAWFTATFLPTILAIFSGPAGWTVLAIAAVVAMVVAFRKPITDFLKWVGDGMRNAALAIGNGIKDIFNGMLRGIIGYVNSAISAINILIRAFNRLPGPDLPLVPRLQVPQFADGGVVNRPTLAMVGEGGEPEYIVPASRMAAASQAYLSGARGAAVLQGRGGGTGPLQIAIQTGPVLRAEGQDWVTTSDLERAMRQTAEAILGRQRTPAGRRAMGIA